MPMSEDFQERLEKVLPQIVEHFPTPFYVYDVKGIREGVERLHKTFSFIQGYINFYAVKANPNLFLLKLLHKLGCGFDCSSPLELILARMAGASPKQIMFSSNATPPEWYKLAAVDGGSFINFDDPTLLESAASAIDFPELFTCRYNPGKRMVRGFTKYIGKPDKAKFGVPHDAIISTYKRARDLGAEHFNLHTMVCSNERNWENLAATVEMELEVAEMLKQQLDIKVELINAGGGFGIPYKPTDNPLDLDSLSRRIKDVFKQFEKRNGFAPRLVTENGRWITGPHGALVMEVVSHKHGRQYGHLECVCVNASTMSALPRTAIYRAYHHLSVFEGKGRPMEEVYVVGPLCENNDYFTCDGKNPAPRLLPKTKIGDLVYAHECGAHVRAMAGNYNSGLRPAELFLNEDNSVELTRPAETIEKMLAEFDFEPKTINLKSKKERRENEFFND